jgi:hypothetical protein
MHKLPETLTMHPFFKTTKNEMNPQSLNYKKQMDNYSILDKKEKHTLFKELLNLGFCWPDPLRQEGFWCDLTEKDFVLKEFPFPQTNQIIEGEIADFISKLTQVENKTPTFKCMGHSTCRICGEQNGNETYYTDLFAWPQGFKHYIKEHGVKPSAAFVLHIRGLIT